MIRRLCDEDCKLHALDGKAISLKSCSDTETAVVGVECGLLRGVLVLGRPGGFIPFSYRFFSQFLCILPILFFLLPMFQL